MKDGNSKRRYCRNESPDQIGSGLGGGQLITENVMKSKYLGGGTDDNYQEDADRNLRHSLDGGHAHRLVQG